MPRMSPTDRQRLRSVRKARSAYTSSVPDHKQYDSKRQSACKRGYDAKWRKLRLMKLRRQPLCEICRSSYRDKIATEVHHIVPLSDGGTNAMDNLQSLCRHCHNKITKQTRNCTIQ